MPNREKSSRALMSRSCNAVGGFYIDSDRIFGWREKQIGAYHVSLFLETTNVWEKKNYVQYPNIIQC